jgi:outer membrane protein W
MPRQLHAHQVAALTALAVVLAAPAVQANGQTPVSQPVGVAPPMTRTLDPQAAGTKELELSGGFSHTEGSDVGTINADIGFGYYIAPRLDLGIRQTLSYNFIDGASDTWTASTIPFLEYHFLTNNPSFRPFLGAFAGAVYNEDDVTGTIGPSAGIRYYLNESTAIVTRYRYEWFFDELTFDDTTDTSDGNHVVTVGFSYSWR